MLIRSATKKDLDECVILSQVPELRHSNGEFNEKKYLIKYLDKDFFLVAEENKEIIGYMYGEKLKDKCSLVWSIVVSKNKRGMGIGTLLISEYEKRMKKNKLEWIILYGNSQNEKTLKFYKKLGYESGNNFTEFVKEF